MNVLMDEEPSAAKVEAAIRLDAGLMLKLLATANTAAFARGAEITDVRRAIVRIGVTETCRIALALCVVDSRQPLVSYAFVPWSRALIRASLAESLGRRMGLPSPGTLYCAGLLSDVGMRALDPLLADSALELGTGTILEAEVGRFGVDHCALAGALLEQWGLPTSLSDLVAYTHAPEAARDPRGARVLQLADAVVRGFRPVGIDALAYPEVELPAGIPDDALDVALLAAMTFSSKLDEVT